MKRKMKAQGSIELMIIAPIMIFFIYVLYLNGVRLHAVLTAANTNYSDGIAIIRSQTDPDVDINASNYSGFWNRCGVVHPDKKLLQGS